jgi:glycosyltransferase involved in cell wall biosynthesis
MQTLAASVWRSLQRKTPRAKLIAHAGSNRGLAFWLLGALPRTAGAIIRGDVDSVITGDALMYALIRPILVAARLPNASMIVGLDVTYPKRLYRALVHPALRKAPRLIAISRATATEAEKIGVRADRIVVLRLGVPAPVVALAERRAAAVAIRHRLSIADGSVLLLTLGRLVRRKGVAWFLRAVMPNLPSNVVYLVAGGGPLENEIRRSVPEHGLDGRVWILGEVDDSDREQLLRGADIFVQPNIYVPGDMEGFGLVLIEASLRGTVSVASAVEGILDAVVDGETGFLVPTEDADAWIRNLTALASRPDQLTMVGARFQASYIGI